MFTILKKPTFNLINIKLIFLAIFSSFLLSVAVVPSQTVLAADEEPSFSRCDSTEDCDITEKLIDPAIKLLTYTIGIVVTAMIIIAGIQYTSAGSDPQKVSAAKSKINNAILALVTYIFFLGLLQWLWPGGVI